MTKTLAVTFNDEPNIIHLYKWIEAGASVVELKMQTKHPRLGRPVIVYYRRTSLRGQNVYYYSEGNKAGEALGG